MYILNKFFFIAIIWLEGFYHTQVVKPLFFKHCHLFSLVMQVSFETNTGHARKLHIFVIRVLQDDPCCRKSSRTNRQGLDVGGVTSHAHKHKQLILDKWCIYGTM